MSNSYWWNNPSVLLKRDKLFKIIPVKDMDDAEKYNSIVRLSLYVSISLSLLNINFIYSSIFFGSLIITYVFFILK